MPASDPFGGLYGADRDAAVAVYSVLKLYGLESLASRINEYIDEGYSEDTMLMLLQETDEWRTRFAGNVLLQRNGYNVLSPAEYISTENAFREMLTAYGFPPGFYDQPADFATAIGNHLSPAGMQRRLQSWQAVFDEQHTQGAEYFQQAYGTTRAGSFAYFIDPTRALPLIEKQTQAALVGGAALAAGFGNIVVGTAERLAERGISEQEALQGFGAAAQLRGLTTQLPGQAGQLVSDEDLVEAEFEGNVDAVKKIRSAAGARTADFGEGGGGFASTKEGVTGLRTAGR